jgi:phosphoribosylformylglycinamidine cyclo-ligase
LTPTRVYVLPLLEALRRTRGIHAFAHITGGGYPDNLPRVLDSGLAVSLDLDAFAPQPVFSWLASVGGLDEGEMLRTFNCGFGMAAFVSADSEAEARDALAGAGLSPVLIGELVSAEGQALLTHGRLEL